MKKLILGIFSFVLLICLTGCVNIRTVYFYDYYNNELARITTTDSSLINLPTCPTPNDYMQFEGWYKDSELTIPFDNKVDSNLFLYPKFNVIENYMLFEMNSGSMTAGGIKIGDMCAIKTNFIIENLCVGDVILYHYLGYEDIYMLHRITNIDLVEKLITTKGDSSNSEDSKRVPFEDVVGIFVENLNNKG